MNVMKVSGDDSSYIFYKTECQCMGDHLHTLELEFDKDLKTVILNLYADVAYAEYWSNSNWIVRKYKTFKIILRLIFTGKFELSETFFFNGKKHVEAYIEALQEGIKKIEEKNGIN